MQAIRAAESTNDSRTKKEDTLQTRVCTHFRSDWMILMILMIARNS